MVVDDDDDSANVARPMRKAKAAKVKQDAPARTAKALHEVIESKCAAKL